MVEGHGDLRILCIADKPGSSNYGASIRSHLLLGTVSQLGSARLVLTTPHSETDLGFLRHAFGVPVEAVDSPAQASLKAKLLRKPWEPWELTRGRTLAKESHIRHLVDEMRPDVIWTTLSGWDALDDYWRRRAFVDMNDRPVEQHAAELRANLSRAGRRLLPRNRKDGSRVALPNFRVFARSADSLLRWSLFEPRLRRTSAAVVVTATRRQPRTHPLLVVPNGWHATAPSPPSRVDLPQWRFVFPGLFNYAPNLDGAEWFAECIWPLLRSRAPSAAIAFAGSCPEGFEDYGRSHGIQVTGFVPDMSAVLTRDSIVIVPLRSGSGTRLKILEAWARGLPVVTTTAGAEGLGCVNKVNALVADSPRDFADACVEIATDSTLRHKVALGGRTRLQEAFTWSHVGRNLCDEIIARSGPRRSRESGTQPERTT